ncbi:MAG: hypothetical protein F4053_08675 [Proteobacteria bacterium]|nr:hypothetical protein [Pseudomonadota bacterium]MYJ95637.1 hypothetical protein [Pseudomonadota bacterium]
MSAEDRESRKSWVRVVVTYGAAGFLFLGGTALIIVLLFLGNNQEALALFQTLVPVAAAIVSYWFAGRGKTSADSQGGNNG